MQKDALPIIFTKIKHGSELITTDDSPIPLRIPSEAVRSLHYHELCEVGICRSGNGFWYGDGHVYAISPGSAVIVPAKLPHYSRGIRERLSDGCRCDFIYFDEEELLRACGIQPYRLLSARTQPIPLVLTRRENDKLRTLLIDMVNEVRTPSEDGEHLRRAAHLYALFLLHEPRKYSKECVDAGPLSPAVTRIMLNFAEEHPVEELATLCSLSRSQFTRLFRDRYGVTPHRFLISLRLEIAEQFLAESTYSVTEISTLVGFTAPSELYRHFIAKHQLSPSDYRRRRDGEGKQAISE